MPTDDEINKEEAVRSECRSVMLEHGDAIYSIFEPMFESWMDDSDKNEFIAMTLHAAGKTLSDLHRDFAAGLANGYSIKQQVDLCRKLFSGQ